MRAGDLYQELPTVDRETTVAQAAQFIADTGLVGVLLVDRGGGPQSVISALDVLRLGLPDYVIEDPSLARVLDEEGAGGVVARLFERTIGELIDDDRVQLHELLWVDADATLMEVAGLLVARRARSAAVRRSDGPSARIITLPIVMRAMLEHHGEDQDGGGNA